MQYATARIHDYWTIKVIDNDEPSWPTSRKINLSCELFVWEKISGESRKIIGTSIWVALSTRAVKLHHNNWPAPRFISSSRSDVKDRSVDWATLLEQLGCIPDMKGESQRFAIKALCQDDIPHLVVEMRVQNWNGAHSLRNLLRWSTANSNNSRSFFLWGKQNCRNIDELGLGWRWGRDHVNVITTSWAHGRNAFRAVARPIAVYVFCWTVPSTLTSAAPHRGGATAEGTRVVDKRDSMHDENTSQVDRYIKNWTRPLDGIVQNAKALLL